ncbi:N-acetyltransferase [Bacillus salacetis]|uniref:N-acetyltransferase n=1 Tax=Bacillus salacetis TaxID=2315464 RepID=A0A3A1QWS2_9BACI|nr:GNAT family protein [Bacillus salacetis]RIW32708.1 N-acetyltransferase [Bacillus salacetis]
MFELQYFTPDDFDQMIGWFDSKREYIQWGGGGFGYPLTRSKLHSHIEGANQEGSKKFIFKLVETETGKAAGHISLESIDRENRSARVCRVLVGDDSMRGKGIGQAMMDEILKTAFGEHQLHRVSLGVYDFNYSAIKCYEKAGFQKEGLKRDVQRYEDEYWNLWEMSILEDEWKKKVDIYQS